MINDGKLVALAELWLGNLQGGDHVRDWIGRWDILDGRLIKGAHFQAGELSFMINASRTADS